LVFANKDYHEVAEGLYQVPGASMIT